MRKAGWAIVLPALAGCASGAGESAWEMVRQQQEQQAYVRQKEDEAMRRQAPSQPHVMAAMIREAVGQGRYFAALAYIEAYRNEFGRAVEVDAIHADVLRQTGQAAQSEAAYRALLSTPQASRGWHGLGLLAAERGDYAQSVLDLARAAQLAPTDALVLSDLGYAHLRAGDLAGARLPLGKAAELAPGNAKVLGNFALLLMLDGDGQRAALVMERAQLSDAARDAVRGLADTIRREQLARRAGEGAASMVAARSDPPPRPVVMPYVDQRPLLDTAGNPSLLY